MEDWLKCQISPLVKYRQNQKKQQHWNEIVQTNSIQTADWSNKPH